MEACMGETAIRRMTAAQFFDWDPGDDARYELVDGVPVMMTGARRRHDQIVVNGVGELGAKLRGHRCRPFTADTAVRIPNGNIRRPDAGVDCGRFDDDAVHADQPRLVIEVLSPSTRQFDTRLSRA
jgi:Uma2 family endonuclease